MPVIDKLFLYEIIEIISRIKIELTVLFLSPWTIICQAGYGIIKDKNVKEGSYIKAGKGHTRTEIKSGSDLEGIYFSPHSISCGRKVKSIHACVLDRQK